MAGSAGVPHTIRTRPTTAAPHKNLGLGASPPVSIWVRERSVDDNNQTSFFRSPSHFPTPGQFSSCLKPPNIRYSPSRPGMGHITWPHSGRGDWVSVDGRYLRVLIGLRANMLVDHANAAVKLGSGGSSPSSSLVMVGVA